MGLGAAGTAWMIFDLLKAMVDSTDQSEGSRGMHDAQMGSMGSDLQGMLQPSQSQRRNISASQRDLALSDPSKRNVRASAELRDLTSGYANALADVTTNIKPSMREAYARAGLLT